MPPSAGLEGSEERVSSSMGVHRCGRDVCSPPGTVTPPAAGWAPTVRGELGTWQGDVPKHHPTPQSLALGCSQQRRSAVVSQPGGQCQWGTHTGGKGEKGRKLKDGV